MGKRRKHKSEISFIESLAIAVDALELIRKMIDGETIQLSDLCKPGDEAISKFGAAEEIIRSNVEGQIAMSQMGHGEMTTSEALDIAVAALSTEAKRSMYSDDETMLLTAARMIRERVNILAVDVQVGGGASLFTPVEGTEVLYCVGSNPKFSRSYIGESMGRRHEDSSLLLVRDLQTRSIFPVSNWRFIVKKGEWMR